MKIDAMLKARKAWQTFAANHPKVPVFVSEVSRKGACENMEIAIAVRYPDGSECKTGIRVKSSDLELLDVLKTLQ